MPLSYSEWAAHRQEQPTNFHHHSFFRAPAGKRKLQTPIIDVGCGMDEEFDCPEKRVCLVPDDHSEVNQQQIFPAAVMDVSSNNGFCVNPTPPHDGCNNNNNNISSNNNNNFFDSNEDMEVGVLPSSSEQIQEMFDSSCMTSTKNLIMDINDETYSQQLKPVVLTSPTTSHLRCANPSVHAQFCRDYCGFGSLSPRSGNVRCYCKPSWEGMIEMNAYYSDIY